MKATKIVKRFIRINMIVDGWNRYFGSILIFELLSIKMLLIKQRVNSK